MYTAFYGLREKPFALSPDPRFLFLAQSHREALAHLLYGIEQGEGFIAITGEVGTGKTTLCRTLLQRLGTENEVAFVFNPKLTALELLQTINAEFGLPCESPSWRALNDALNRFLLDKKREGKRVLLIIDEAQNLERETLEQVRLLSNLETETSKLIQIVLLGQPELDALLESPELRQLKQRIGVRWRLRPLSPGEMREYVRHRIRVAAGAAREIFSPAALRELQRYSGGVPRVLNVLCDRALLAGYAAGEHEVTPRLVRQAADEVRGRGTRRGWRARLGRPAPLDLGLAGALVVCAGLWLWLGGREPGATPPAVSAPPPGASAAAPASGTPGAPAAAPASGATEATPSAAAPPGSSLVAPAVAAAPSPGPGAGAPLRSAGSPVASPADGPLPPLRDLLTDHSPEATAASAFAALFTAWGLPPEVMPPRSLPDALAVLARREMGVLGLPEADLETLRALNHPAVLEIEGADGVPRLVVLRSLEPGEATLYGVGPTGTVRVSASELDALWRGKAWIAWRDFESLPETLSVGEGGAAVLWLQDALATLGFYTGPLTGRMDAATEEAVRAFQRSRALSEDGTVGPRTKMALYDSLEAYAVPRLRAGRDVG